MIAAISERLLKRELFSMMLLQVPLIFLLKIAENQAAVQE
jgi:hypothetical protein